jgi:hypothetical protein
MADLNNSNKASLTLSVKGFDFNSKKVEEVSMSVDTDTTDNVQLGVTPQLTEALESVCQTIDRSSWLREAVNVGVDVLSARVKRADKVRAVEDELKMLKLHLELEKAQKELDELRNKKA